MPTAKRPGGAATDYRFFVIALNPDEHDRLRHELGRERFSITVPSSAGSAGHGRWALVIRRNVRERRITHLGFARSSGAASAFDRRITVERLEELSDPIELADIQNAMAPVHYGALKAASAERGGELTQAASTNLLAALTQSVPDGMWRRLRPRDRSSRDQIETLHSQYDALATGLGIAGFDAANLDDRTYDAERSVLEVVRQSPTEPDLIMTDIQHFAWSRSKSIREHVHRFKKHGRVLDVINLNATPQEAALGVDLLYYNQGFSSFLGVQYKRAEAQGGELGRVDDRMLSQIQRMLKVEELGSRSASRPIDFRLGGSSMMFIKFARPADVPVQVSGMSKGWYVPARYASALIDAGEANGPRGGATFTLDNLNRWLVNDDFVHLAGEGWIGSIGVDAGALKEYIDSALEEKRSMMLMESRASRPSQ